MFLKKIINRIENNQGLQMIKVKLLLLIRNKELSLSRIMFEVKSFLKKNNDFIPISEFTDEISDPNYIEGAIEISK